MEIKGISNQNLYGPHSKSKTTVESNEVQAAKDKIEISEEARNMAKTTEISPERLEQIRNRIDSKFYSSAEVLSKVADKILKEIK